MNENRNGSPVLDLRHFAENRAKVPPEELAKYAGQLRLAQLAWKDNRADLAMHYLDSCQWSLRGWEYDYLYSQFTSNHITLYGPGRQIGGVAFSPDGKQLAARSERGVTIWNTAKWREMHGDW